MARVLFSLSVGDEGLVGIPPHPPPPLPPPTFRCPLRSHNQEARDSRGGSEVRGSGPGQDRPHSALRPDGSSPRALGSFRALCLSVFSFYTLGPRPRDSDASSFLLLCWVQTSPYRSGRLVPGAKYPGKALDSRVLTPQGKVSAHIPCLGRRKILERTKFMEHSRVVPSLFLNPASGI